jgi:aminomethyltransferase
VLANAKAFARALKDAGLQVAGDPAISYTETHQVVVDVGYSRGPEVARRLEDNNIVVNYQAAPDEEGFTASGALRMGVQEMTRFGMESDDFAELAGYIRDVVLNGAAIREEVSRFRQRFLQLQYCFSDGETEALLAEVRDLI